MGPICSRNCLFCNISSGLPNSIDPDEPHNVARVAAELELSHIVITSVTRDDLPDGGANHFNRTVLEIKKQLPEATIELLTPDFKGRKDLLAIVLETKPTVFNHNIETVPRLYPMIRPQANFQRSLEVLLYAAHNFPEIITKSGLMVGVGEDKEEIVGVFQDLARAGVKVLTIGQYLPPTRNHHPLSRYYSPDEFTELKTLAQRAGISRVISGPLVRSSYKAEEAIT
jgi:lipoic acid synthetase